MTRRNAIKTALLGVLMLVGMVLTPLSAAGAPSDEREQLKQRFKERYPKLLAAFNAGTLGETAKGFVEAVRTEVDGDAKKLMNEENADRRKLYQLLAAETGTTSEKVAERAAVKNFSVARPGHWLKGADGKWVRKGGR